jgi:hypothetical protein
LCETVEFAPQARLNLKAVRREKAGRAVAGAAARRAGLYGRRSANQIRIAGTSPYQFRSGARIDRNDDVDLGADEFYIERAANVAPERCDDQAGLGFNEHIGTVKLTFQQGHYAPRASPQLRFGLASFSLHRSDPI